MTGNWVLPSLCQAYPGEKGESQIHQVYNTPKHDSLINQVSVNFSYIHNDCLYCLCLFFEAKAPVSLLKMFQKI